MGCKMLPRGPGWAFAFVLLALVGCYEHSSPSPPPEMLRFGVEPDQSLDAIEANYAPLFRYLSEQTGLPYEFVPTETYPDLVRLFAAGKVNLAFLGGAIFLQAEQAGGAVPIAMRNVDLRFTTLFVARESDPRKSIEEFHGDRFSFGSRLSTSGHLMPRYFLEQRGIRPEDFFGDVVYSDAHDRTAYAVRDGDADLGAVNSAIFREMLADGRLKREQLRVVWETPTYPDYVWAVHPSLGRQLTLRIRDALLALNWHNPDHKEILAKVDTRNFLPAAYEDFGMLRQIAERVGFVSNATQ